MKFNRFPQSVALIVSLAAIFLISSLFFNAVLVQAQESAPAQAGNEQQQSQQGDGESETANQANVTSTTPSAGDIEETEIAKQYKANTSQTLAAASFIVKSITLVGWFIKWAIRLGIEVTHLPIVRVGYQVILNLTNLGFVLAIIIIAYATIFRRQSYAMNKTLGKLVIAALLVNFSFAIASGIISVSNNLTQYMVDKMGSDLSTSLATLLNPQILIKVNDDPNWLKTVKALTDVDYLLKLLLSLLFVLVFTIAVFLIFAGIFIMLLIRVVYLALLLIIMPIVWLAWIFPNTASYWKKWWNEFIRWTFFAPIMMLGMYLIVVTGQEMKNLQIT